MSVIAIIPARGGSKGVPRKNIKKLAGKPLIAYTIEEAKKSKHLTKIIVSTEDAEIKQIAQQYGAEIIDRPEVLAQDTTPTLPVLQHVVKTVEGNGERVDLVVLLQATALFKKVGEIDAAIEKMQKGYHDSLISLSPVPKHFNPLWQKQISQDQVFNMDGHGINDDKKANRRQNIPKTYWKNGQIYIMGRNTLMVKDSLFGETCTSFIIDRKDMVNIDVPEDFEQAEQLLQKKHKDDTSTLTMKDLTKKVFIIAEIGKNFIQTEEERPVAEYLDNAKKLVMAAKTAGADAVKFQTHTVEDEQLNIDVTSPHFKGSDRYSWVSRNTRSTPMETFWKPLKDYCDELGIRFFSCPMSRGSAKKLTELGVELWKVGSGDILDFVTLDYMAETKKPIIISCGMSTLEETDKAINYLKQKNADFALLHCVSKYPCPPEELNLESIKFLKERYDGIVGFSDHSTSIDPAIAAVSFGAKIVEKHFTFDRKYWGADHKVSITPEEFKQLVEGIRELEKDPAKKQAYLEKDIVKASLGKPAKLLQQGESVFRDYFRKSLMAGCDIPEGTVLTKNMIFAMRPQKFAGGLPSEKYEDILGKKSTKALKKYDPLTEVVVQ